ncbi:MAG: hypothetical protein QNJ64_11010 [Crocosphaera sp.]|nr:hypothetical protein [Crocosphaera sp.]
MSKKLIFKGQTSCLEYHWYAQLIFPLVQVKNLLQIVYEFIIHLIWSELVYGKKNNNEITTLVAFFIFCIFSLIACYLRDYIQVILLVCFLIWYLDGWIAKHQHLKHNHKIDIFVYEMDSNQVICCLRLPENEIQSIFGSFTQQEISDIVIKKTSLLGGAFQEVLEQVWQIEIYLHNGKHFVVDENLLIHEALIKSKKLAAYFDVNVIFSGSQGNHSYVEQKLNITYLDSLLHQQKLDVKYKKNPKKWHIYTQWHWSNSWIFIKNLFHKAGFLLFLIIMTGFMINFGELLHRIILSLQGQNVTIDLTLIVKLFIPKWHWRNLLELGLVLGIFIYQGWQLSRVKHIYVTQHYLRFFVDDKLIDKIQTTEIETSFLLNKYFAEILIVGQKKIINITAFHQQKSAEIFWCYLQEAINYFQSEKTEKQKNE